MKVSLKCSKYYAMAFETFEIIRVWDFVLVNQMHK